MKLYSIMALSQFACIFTIIACLIAIVILALVIIFLSLHIKGLYKLLEDKENNEEKEKRKSKN